MNLITTNRNLQLMTRCGFTLLASFLLPGTAWAGDAETIADLQARLATVERNIDQLVEGEGSSSANPGIPIHGFADVGFTRASNNDTRLNQAGHGFWANALDLYLTPQFTDNSKALVELIFEFLPDGLATDLERIQLGYTFSDRLTTWVGRFHAPYGNWNTAYHHGAEIQTSITRPRFIDFEDKGGLLPAHVMGAWATGDVPLGSAKLTYDLYVGNGNAIVGVADDTEPSPRGYLTINNARDSNNNTLVGANVGYKRGGMVVGVHGFSQRVNIEDHLSASLGEVNVKMAGLYGAYEGGNWEGVAEYYRFKNDNLTMPNGSKSSWLGFTQLGYAVGDKWMPYARLEKATLNQEDPYFNYQAYGVSYQREVVGARYMLNAKAALKLEANQTKEGDGVPATGLHNGSYKEVRAQYSIRF